MKRKYPEMSLHNERMLRNQLSGKQLTAICAKYGWAEADYSDDDALLYRHIGHEHFKVATKGMIDDFLQDWSNRPTTTTENLVSNKVQCGYPEQSMVADGILDYLKSLGFKENEQGELLSSGLGGMKHSQINALIAGIGVVFLIAAFDLSTTKGILFSIGIALYAWGYNRYFHGNPK